MLPLNLIASVGGKLVCGFFQLIKEIKDIINLDGDEYSDGECIDMIVELIEKEK